ncbi:cytokine receptor common subunit gamma [Hyla sarda]|uniref:cytokine receptor common subunit gamma n=1 Tax=Hyla sarda TaxID=327740 RepID=UPI0024C45558|nr:cytokine receptor common subunit gamma [Hyla sarda]
MSLDGKYMKQSYSIFLQINLVRLGPSFFFMIMLSTLNHSIEGSEKLDDVKLNCFVNKMKILTCTWNEQTDQNDNYTLYYWYSDQESFHCPKYLVANHKTTGCQLSVKDTFRTFTVKLNTTSPGFPTIHKFDKLQDWVKMDPPSNVHVENTSSLELLLTWEQSFGLFPPHCMAYQVQHRNMAGEKWMVKDASSTSFTLPSYDPRQIYTFRVRSQISIHCGNSKLWSDWSQAVVWGRNITVTDEQPSTYKNALVILAVTFMLLVVVVFVIRTDRVWMIFVPQIPNPGKKFEDLFNVYKYNFQDWLGISKEAVENLKTNYTETFCIVTEDPDCPGPDEKNPTINLPTE